MLMNGGARKTPPHPRATATPLSREERPLGRVSKDWPRAPASIFRDAAQNARLLWMRAECVAPVRLSQHDPRRRMITGAFFAADGAVDASLEQARRQCGAEQ